MMTDYPIRPSGRIEPIVGLEDPWEFWYHHHSHLQNTPCGDWNWKTALKSQPIGSAPMGFKSFLQRALKANEPPHTETNVLAEMDLSPQVRESLATYEPGKLRAIAETPGICAIPGHRWH